MSQIRAEEPRGLDGKSCKRHISRRVVYRPEIGQPTRGHESGPWREPLRKECVAEQKGRNARPTGRESTSEVDNLRVVQAPPYLFFCPSASKSFLLPSVPHSSGSYILTVLEILEFILASYCYSYCYHFDLAKYLLICFLSCHAVIKRNGSSWRRHAHESVHEWYALFRQGHILSYLSLMPFLISSGH